MVTQAALQGLINRLIPGSLVLGIAPFSPDEQPDGGTAKGLGYGVPVRVRLRDPGGAERSVVFHTEAPGAFGHERRADRARNMLLSYDTFPAIPQHVEALDVGVVASDGELLSLRGGGEFFLVTTYAEGSLYAGDLRRVGRERRSLEPDRRRAVALADYLVDLHARRIGDGPGYRRVLRDVVGHGEGIFGVIDGYPDAVPGAPTGRLQEIETLASSFRWRLRRTEGRLTRIHGDFHPFNLVFSTGGELTALDASRGCEGDAADDVVCLSINYLFFALETEGSWTEGFLPLWKAFWEHYLARTSDEGLLLVAPLYLAWRALVIANPRFYPDLRASTRESLLGLAERALGRGRFDPREAEDLFG